MMWLVSHGYLFWHDMENEFLVCSSARMMVVDCLKT